MVLGDLHVSLLRYLASTQIRESPDPFSSQVNFGDYVAKHHGGEALWADVVAKAGHPEGMKWITSCPYMDSIFDG